MELTTRERYLFSCRFKEVREVKRHSIRNLQSGSSKNRYPSQKRLHLNRGYDRNKGRIFFEGSTKKACFFNTPDLSIKWRRHPDLNRSITVLQTAALPLGYAATKKMERANGFEPSTSTLARWHSTAELRPLPQPQQCWPEYNRWTFLSTEILPDALFFTSDSTPIKFGKVIQSRIDRKNKSDIEGHHTHRVSIYPPKWIVDNQCDHGHGLAEGLFLS